ncbi:DUF1259 domain-containing protein [Candidatus Binatia bacterium]|nr:DUF1259 domain-containing protein [Candidatus Binatia bacterium]
MTRTVLVVAVLLVVAIVRSAAATEPDGDAIARITGRKPEVTGGVTKISVPRADLAVRVDGIALAPFQGLTSWAAFEAAGSESMLMGDIVLTEDEVNPALSAALENGLEVTALHNHFAFDEPRMMFMHIGGHGPSERLATGVKATLDAVERVSTERAANGGKPVALNAGRSLPATSSIDPKALEQILGGTAQAKDGMAKFVFARKTSMHGADAEAAMGVNTWAVFAGSPDDAVVDGDVAMLDGEVQAVLKALRHGGINVVAMHNHMIGEQPQIVFLHFWGRGRASDLATTLAAARSVQAP